jgi:ubiquinone/menaquinone biosynthesis C-methylase UbiE
MSNQWPDYPLTFTRERYNRIAAYFPIFEWLFFLPRPLRGEAVRELQLQPGQRVLEVGCGTGRNLALLREAVGTTGDVFGIDLSEGMLSRAEALRARESWDNVTLVLGDAAKYEAPGPLDGVLFSLSYATMPHHLAVLEHTWRQLRPGGRLVILDSKIPEGVWGGPLWPLVSNFVALIMKRTVLGNPFIRSWEELQDLADEFVMREFRSGWYYICRGTKLSAADAQTFAASAPSRSSIET